MNDSRTMQDLIRALKHNTRATEALHAVLVETGRMHKNDLKIADEEKQLIAKKAVQNINLNTAVYCRHCAVTACVPGDPTNNWAGSGCVCCEKNHD